MEIYIIWGSVGLLCLFLLVGLLSGLTRGLKRSSLHLLFFVISFVLSFLITKSITNAVLGINITVGGTTQSISNHIINMVEEQFNLASFESAQTFLHNLPTAIASPIVFLLISYICYFLFDIIYLIIARVSFGKKKKDFQKNKPYRAYGAVVGVFEGLLCLFITFAPLTALTNTYAELAEVQAAAQVYSQSEQENSNQMKTIGETLAEFIPQEVHEIIMSYNDSVIGKVSGAGGVDNLLFDGLSNFKVDGEKIKFREEIINLADCYDDFVVVYNGINTDITQVDLTSLRASVEKFLDDGLFKSVVSNTIRDVIVKFEEIKEDLNLTELPQIAQDIINDLYTVFTADDFDPSAYLKENILDVIDTFTNVLDYELIEKFNALENQEIETILEYINTNSTEIKNVLKEALSVRIINDCYNSIGKFASQSFQEALESDPALEMKLNMTKENKNQMVEDIFSAVSGIVELSQDINIFEITDSENPTEIIVSLDEETVVKLGQVLDKINEINILVLPVEDGVRTEPAYVFTNFMKSVGMDFLGDNVITSLGVDTINTYEEFFTFISKPIDVINQLELTTETETDVILEKFKLALDANPGLVRDVLIPFYQLDVANIQGTSFKDLLFNDIFKIVLTLGSGDSDATEEEKDQAINQFIQTVEDGKTTKLEKVLLMDNELLAMSKYLNVGFHGEVVVGDKTYSYFEYHKLDGIYQEDLFKAALSQKTVDGIRTDFEILADACLDSKVTGLKNNIFMGFDDAIHSLTGQRIETPTEINAADKSKIISDLKEIFEIVLDLEEICDICYPKLGKIIDILKSNAYNNGGTKGIFDDAFKALVWYATGDDMNETATFTGTPHSMSADIKKYLAVEELEDYYTINFEEKLKEISKALNLAESLTSAIEGISLSVDTIEEYVEAIKEVVNAMEGTDAENTAIIENLTTLVNNNAEYKLLSDTDKEIYGSTIVTALEDGTTGIKYPTELKALFGLSA